MYTFAPFATRAAAIIFPIPDPPPVTKADKGYHVSIGRLLLTNPYNVIERTEFPFDRKEILNIQSCKSIRVNYQNL